MRITLLTLVLTLLGGCLSADRADQRWQAWVDEHNACEVADDCVIVYPSCPLGCFTAVSAEHEQAANDKADALVRAYERPGRSCAYDCLQAGPPTCDDGTCAVGPVDTGL